jgi:hypothetical protein
MSFFRLREGWVIAEPLQFSVSYKSYFRAFVTCLSVVSSVVDVVAGQALVSCTPTLCPTIPASVSHSIRVIKGAVYLGCLALMSPAAVYYLCRSRQVVRLHAAAARS